MFSPHWFSIVIAIPGSFCWFIQYTNCNVYSTFEIWMKICLPFILLNYVFGLYWIVHGFDPKDIEWSNLPAPPLPWVQSNHYMTQWFCLMIFYVQPIFKPKSKFHIYNHTHMWFNGISKLNASIFKLNRFNIYMYVWKSWFAM